MARSKKTSSGGSGNAGGTTQACPQEGTLIVIAHLTGGEPKPFPDGLDLDVVQSVRASGSGGGQSGKTDGNGLKEFKGLVTNLYTVTAKLSGANAKKYELLGTGRATANVPAGGSAMVNFDLVPLHDLRVRVKVKGSSPPEFLKPDRVALKQAQGKFETSAKPDGTWEFKRLHPGTVVIEARLTAEDREKYDLVAPTTEHLLRETPQPNEVEVEVLRKPLMVPLYFVFRFLDPEAKPRTLPGRLPVKIKLSELAPARPGDGPPGPDTYDAELNEAGVLVPPGEAAAPFRVPRSYKKLTIELTQTERRYVICEPAGDAAVSATCALHEDTPEFRERLRKNRSFMLPWKRAWTLDTADWDIKDGAADAKSRLQGLSDTATLFGTPAQMLAFTLKPRWQFARFTYFDRYYGFAHHGKASISIPAVRLRGYREIPGKAKTAEAETAAGDAAAKQGTLEEKRDALHLAQDILDGIDADVAFKLYLKNWYEANRPVGNADRTKAVNDYNTAVAPQAGAATAVTSAQTAFDTAQTEATAAATALSTKLAAAEEEWKKAEPSVESTWLCLPGGKSEQAVQCLPWILNKKADNSPDTALDADVVLEFVTEADSYVCSTSATAREVITVAAGDKKLEPSADRLKLYDLPPVWRSRRYFARLGAKANRFEQLAAKPTSLAEPITFALDDVVLCQRIDGGETLRVLTDKEWAPDRRCTLFHHRFRDTAADGSNLADVSKQGVYKPDTAGNRSYLSLVPTGTAAGTAADATVEKDRNYIADYPHWTRLVLARGNLFDVFDRRTPASAIGVTGARAAVCWRDVTAELPGVTMQMSSWVPTSPTSGNWGTVAARNNRPSCNKAFQSRPSAEAGGRYLHVQPYLEQEYHSFRNDKFDTSRSNGIGRVDYALIRCCGKIGDGATAKEHAVNLHFTRNFFQFTPNAATALSTTGMGEEAWKDAWISNCINRWNGDDPGKNTSRARLLPADLPDGSKPKVAVECDVLWFMHVTDRLRAQFLVNVEDRGANARDNRGGLAGTGESSPGGYQDGSTTGQDFSGASVNTGWYPSAHESGHADGLPDEYNERWDGSSHGQMSYKSNLPGDPYEPDGRMVSWATNGSPMMNGNQLIRNRYFWVSAEWVRRRIEASVSPAPFRVVYRSPTGTDYDKFMLPPHSQEKRTYYCWPLRAAIDHTVATARGMRNFFLFPLGNEEWTVRDIYARQNPAKAPDPANPYDGICMIAINLEALLPSWPLGGAADAPTTSDNRRAILRAITQVMLSEFNFKWYLSGKVTEGSAEWTFKRCLIFFSLRYLDGNDGGAAALRTQFGSHFVLDTVHSTGAASEAWQGALGAANSDRYRVTTDFTDVNHPSVLALKVRDAFPAMLGINKAWNAMTTADLQAFLAPLNVQALLVHDV